MPIVHQLISAPPEYAPEESHSMCGIVVSDTEPLHQLFAEGFRASRGKVPQRGAPRMTRPRRRANNAGLSGFSVIDPAGNWIRVSRRPEVRTEPRTVDDRIEWSSAGGGPLARVARAQREVAELGIRAERDHPDAAPGD